MLIKELVGSVSTIRTDRRKLRQFSGYVESDPIYEEYHGRLVESDREPLPKDLNPGVGHV
jgi:hypothetical protein